MPEAPVTAQSNNCHLITLLYEMDAAYNNSKTWLMWSLLSALIGVFLLLGFYYYEKRATGAACALALQILAYWFKRKSSSSYREGHALERSAILNHGLADPHPRFLPCRIPSTKDTTEYEKYFFSERSKPGARRLLEDIAESSYFTKEIALGMQRVFKAIAYGGPIVVVGLFVATFVLVLDFRDSSLCAGLWSRFRGTVPLWVEAAFIALGFFAVGEFTVIYTQCESLAKEMSEIYLEATRQLESRQPLRIKMAMRLLTGYSCALMDSPPLFGTIYLSKKERLNKDWREGIGKYLSDLEADPKDEVILPEDEVSRSV